MWVVLFITILSVGWGWKNSRYLLPLLIVALPLEISRTWFPHMYILDKLGKFVGTIYFGRILTLAVIAYFIYNLIHSKKTDQISKTARDDLAEIIHSPLFIALGSYIIWGAFSVIWSIDRLQTIVGVARLSLLWLLGAAVYYLVKRRDGLITVPLAFAVVSSFLAGLGIYELLSQRYFWFSEIFQPLGRINATFVDANIYARFLLIGIIATTVLMLNATRVGRITGAIALALQMAALVGTGSRMGWIDMIIIAIAFGALIPRRVVIVPILGVLSLSGMSILLNHKLLLRVLEVKQNFWAASLERHYLIDLGVQMFTQHPLLGIGLAGFQHVMLTTYASIIHNGVSLSHTTLITTAAELGVIGLGILVVFFVVLYGGLLRDRKALHFSSQQFFDTGRYYWDVFAVLAITAIFISAQGEGRFFEDPYLWIITGYLTAARDFKKVS